MTEITDKKENTAVNPITEGRIGKEMLFFFLPLMFGTFFQLLYNTADSVIVGQFVGKEALAAVGGSAAILVRSEEHTWVGLPPFLPVPLSSLASTTERAKRTKYPKPFTPEWPSP